MSRYGYNYGYTYRNGPLLRWGHGTPVQSKAADAQALGSLSGTAPGGHTLSGSTLAGSTLLPAPGAPEPIGVTGKSMMPMGMGGCSCTGTCGCGTGTGLSGLADSVPGGYLTIGGVALLAWHFLRKRRR
jgi:hypothetical protein